MRIIILDGYTANPRDLDWSAFATLGELTVHDRTAPDQIIDRCRNAEIVLTNKVVLDAATIAALPQLRYVGVLATGYNVVDVKAAAEHDIAVTNVPGYSTESVVQHVFAFILHFAAAIPPHARAVAAGDWIRSEDFCFYRAPLTEIAGKTLGIVGFGSIGSRIAAVANAFGMRVIAHTRSRKQAPDVEFLPINAVFEQADYLTLHCPLTDQTARIVNQSRLASMKPTAILINTGRGPLLDEAAVAAALGSGTLAGAGLDVLSTEPPATDNPLLAAPNCVITPHVAWATREARRRLLDDAANNLAQFLAGKPRNRVN